MKLTLRLIENLQRLTIGESIAYSSLPKDFVEALVKEGILTLAYHKTKRCVMASNSKA